jgi:hypothetical protein
MAAIVDRVTAQPSTPEANADAGIASTFAPERTPLGSATTESKRLDTPRSLFRTGSAPSNSAEFESVVSKGGLTTDEARRRLAKSGIRPLAALGHILSG